jgi:hypothetical protein
MNEYTRSQMDHDIAEHITDAVVVRIASEYHTDGMYDAVARGARAAQGAAARGARAAQGAVGKAKNMARAGAAKARQFQGGFNQQNQGPLRQPNQNQGYSRQPNQNQGSSRQPNQNQGSSRQPNQNQGSSRQSNPPPQGHWEKVWVQG